MSEITPEQLDELNKLADEQHKLNRLIKHIENPEYTVMYKTFKGYFPLDNTIYEEEDELKVNVKNMFRSPEAYLDLYNIDFEDDIRVYKEIKNWERM